MTKMKRWLVYGEPEVEDDGGWVQWDDAAIEIARLEALIMQLSEALLEWQSARSAILTDSTGIAAKFNRLADAENRLMQIKVTK